MSLNRERAQALYNMIAGNRKIAKLLGDDSLAGYIDKLDEYLYPSKAREKGIELDESTREMRAMLDKFKPILRNLESAANASAEHLNGLTEYEENEMRDSLDNIFSANPSPDEVMANYLRDHGDKQLASEEYQFATALIGAMHGLNDIMDHEYSTGGLQSRAFYLQQIKENLSEIGETRKNAETVAVRAGIDVNDTALNMLKDEIEAEDIALNREEKELKAAIDAEEENAKLNIPEESRYDALKSEIRKAKLEADDARQRSKKFTKIANNARNYESVGLKKLIKAYDPLLARYNEAEKELHETEGRVGKNTAERSKRIEELIKAQSEIMSHGGVELEEKIRIAQKLPAVILDMEKGVQLLQKQLSDTGICEAMVSEFVETVGTAEDMILKGTEREAKEEILKTATEWQKYLVAKDDILCGFAGNEEQEEAVKEKFHNMEMFLFKDNPLEAVKNEVLGELVPSAEKQLQDRIKALYDDKRVAEYFALQKEKNQLSRLNKIDEDELGKISEKYKDLKYDLWKLSDRHKTVCTELCLSAGITSPNEISEYSNLKNWNSLKQRINEKVASVNETQKKAKERVEKGEAILKKEAKTFEEVKRKQENHTNAEIELGNKLTRLTKRQADLRAKKQAYNEIKAAKSAMKLSMPLTFNMEENFCRQTAASFNGHFASDRISSQLDKLADNLAAPKRGSNSEEYTQLKNTLEEAKRVFAGKEENWKTMTFAQRRARQQEILEQLGQKASHYLGEKEKQPHIWPFASTSGFKRRAAAEDILALSKSAADIVKNTSDLEFEISDRIAGCKNAEGEWIEDRTDKLVKAAMTDFERSVKNLSKNPKAADIAVPEAQNELSKKKGGRALGSY